MARATGTALRTPEAYARVATVGGEEIQALLFPLDVARVNPLRMVDLDRFDHALLLQLLDRCPRERTVDLQALDERRRSDELHL